MIFTIEQANGQRMSEMTINEQLQKMLEQMCDEYCKYPNMTPPEGKDDNWLYEDGSPCEKCPLNNL